MKTHRGAQFKGYWLAAGLFAGGWLGMVLGPLAAGPALAAGVTTLSGRVYNISTGSGYGGVTLALCGGGTAVTNGNGNWELTVSSGTNYCVRIAGGAPKPPSGPVTRNNPDVGTVGTYENQVAGVNCYHSPSCPAEVQKWDRPVDGGLDFVYSNDAPAAPPAPSAATPDPAPAAPAATPAGGFGAPPDFSAKPAADSDHTVNLSWTPVGEVKSYKLERSLDRNTWEVTADGLTDAKYQDQKALPGVHYYYRLSAINAAGMASDYALVDVAMGDVLAATSQPDGDYSSTDGVARVMVYAGTLPAGASCTVSTLPRPSDGGGRTVLAGAYQLQCKDSLGATISEFKRSVSWQFKLAHKLQGYQPPQLVQQSNDGKTESKSGSYDTKSGVFKVDADGGAAVYVAASAIDYGWVGYVAIGGIVLLVLAALALIPIRSRRKMSYQEYLRAKYYDL